MNYIRKNLMVFLFVPLCIVIVAVHVNSLEHRLLELFVEFFKAALIYGSFVGYRSKKNNKFYDFWSIFIFVLLYSTLFDLLSACVGFIGINNIYYSGLDKFLSVSGDLVLFGLGSFFLLIYGKNLIKKKSFFILNITVIVLLAVAVYFNKLSFVVSEVVIEVLEYFFILFVFVFLKYKNKVKVPGINILPLFYLMILFVSLSELFHIIDDFLYSSQTIDFLSHVANVFFAYTIFHIFNSLSKSVLNEEIRLRKDTEKKLYKLSWLLTRTFSDNLIGASASTGFTVPELYVSEKKGFIADLLGEDFFKDFFNSHVALLGLSVSLYESDGSFCIAAYQHSWCKVIHDFKSISKENTEIFNCFDSEKCNATQCPELASLVIKKGEAQEITCAGGLTVYSVPIFVNDKAVAALNISYGLPPRNKDIIEKIAENKNIDVTVLEEISSAYEERPQFMIDFARSNIAVTASIIGLSASAKQAEQRYQKSANENNLLLKEMHHRVKNNMQIISSILNLQGTYLKDENSINVLKDIQSRIKSMSCVHEQLYISESMSRVSIPEYIMQIENYLKSLYSCPPGIVFKYELDTLDLNIVQAVPCGLLINEIISNALKYAFVNTDTGVVEIKVMKNGDMCAIQVSDSGVGSVDADIFYESNSLGHVLIESLVKQLEGELILSVENGYKYDITFPIESFSHVNVA